MDSIVRTKLTTPGILLTVGIALAFILGAMVNGAADANSGIDVPAYKAGATTQP
ncbi:MAG: hypothetical protein AAGF10_07925 [Verrucomicrobiota bacterium]